MPDEEKDSSMLAPHRTRAAVAYSVAAVSLLLATLFRFLLDPVLGDHLSFSFYFLAVAVAAWTGGVWPALVTAALSCLVAEFFFTHPQFSFQISAVEELISMLLFIAVSVVIGILSEISLRALERASRAEQAKDEFLATLAHELRSPLSVIHYANSLQRAASTDESADHSEMIDRQVRRLNSMIQELLDISRVARGKIHLDRQQIDAAAVVEGALERARPLMDSREHVVEVDVSPEAMPLYADQARLEQVLSNLLTNAAKYTPNGGHISISVQPVDDSVVFTVRDNGIGISRDMLPVVFDMFVQADPQSPVAEEGLGIGLALVKHLVELHGGSVRASSEGRNCGSEFVVTLPLQQPAVADRELVEA